MVEHSVKVAVLSHAYLNSWYCAPTYLAYALNYTSTSRITIEYDRYHGPVYQSSQTATWFLLKFGPKIKLVK